MKSNSFFSFGRVASLMLATLAVVCSLTFVTGCTEVKYEEIAHYYYVLPLESNDSLIADWESSYDEKYAISQTDYDNYSKYSADGPTTDFNLYYSTNNIKKLAVNSSSGYIYGQFDDADHIGYGAKVGQWYALYYNNLTDSSVSFYQAYKAGGKSACDTLEEAVKEFTVENGYFDLSKPSECKKSN